MMKKLTIDFVREEFEARGYELLETEYINNSTKMRYKCPNHPDKELRTTWNNFNSKHQRCPYCAGNVKLDFNFVKSEFEKRGYELLEKEYYGSGMLMSYKCKYHQNEILSMSYDNLKQGHGCPICSGRQPAIGYTDMWTTNPELASKLLNPKDGYKYTQFSSKKVDWKCSDCGSVVKNKIINTVNKQGVSCFLCGDGISYPQKNMSNILTELNVNFDTEQSFDWCVFELNGKNYHGRYDFVFEYNNQNYIVEVDGGLGHGNKTYTKSKYTKEDLIYVDKMKDKLAKENNYEIIRIDCFLSDFKYIKNSIFQSKLSELFDLKIIDWNLCHKKALKSKILEACELWNSGIKSTSEIGKILHVCTATASQYLKQGAKIGICNYSPNLSIKKKNICTTTKQIFNSITEAHLYYNITTQNINNCCCGRSKSAGKHPETGEKLVWQYYDPLIHTPENGYSYV